ncbi:Uncharacterised protein [Achromobacter xylosoxidans]|nr:Uncharacterised protein [Achromobacter xylosoxidans]
MLLTLRNPAPSDNPSSVPVAKLYLVHRLKVWRGVMKTYCCDFWSSVPFSVLVVV